MELSTENRIWSSVKAEESQFVTFGFLKFMLNFDGIVMIEQFL